MLGDEGADAYAALVVALRHGVDQHHLLLDAGQMEGRDVGRARVAELAVDLVGEKEEVVFLHEVADLEHLLHCVEIAGGVVGVADEYALCARSDQFLEFLDGGQCEAFVDARGHGDDLGSGRDGEGHIVGVGRLGHDDLVARIETCHKGEQHGLGAAGGDDDVVDIDVDIETLVILLQLLAQRRQTVRRAVFQHFAVDLLESFKAFGRCRHIGLADIEPVDLYASFGSLCGKRIEATDRRRRHDTSSMRYFWHIILS